MPKSADLADIKSAENFLINVGFYTRKRIKNLMYLEPTKLGEKRQILRDIESIRNYRDKVKVKEAKEVLKSQRNEIENYLNINPIESFGDNFAEFYHDGSGAIQKLLAEKRGQVAGAFSRDDLGDIDLVWGDSKKGLQHIIERRKEQYKELGFSEKEAEKKAYELIENIGDIIEKGKIEKGDNNRVRIETPKERAIIVPEYKGKNRKWLLTAFEKNEALDPADSHQVKRNGVASSFIATPTSAENIAQSSAKSQAQSEILSKAAQELNERAQKAKAQNKPNKAAFFEKRAKEAENEAKQIENKAIKAEQEAKAAEQEAQKAQNEAKQIENKAIKAENEADSSLSLSAKADNLRDYRVKPDNDKRSADSIDSIAPNIESKQADSIDSIKNTDSIESKSTDSIESKQADSIASTNEAQKAQNISEYFDKTKPLKSLQSSEITENLLKEAQSINGKIRAADFQNEKIAQTIGLDLNYPIKQTIQGDKITHALNRHGADSNLAQKSGKEPTSYSDLSKFADFTNKADLYAIKEAKDGKILLSGKQINGHFIVVESIATKPNELKFITFYKEQGKLTDNADFMNSQMVLTSQGSSYAPSLKPSVELDKTSASENIAQSSAKSQVNNSEVDEIISKLSNDESKKIHFESDLGILTSNSLYDHQKLFNSKINWDNVGDTLKEHIKSRIGDKLNFYLIKAKEKQEYFEAKKMELLKNRPPQKIDYKENATQQERFKALFAHEDKIKEFEKQLKEIESNIARYRLIYTGYYQEIFRMAKKKDFSSFEKTIDLKEKEIFETKKAKVLRAINKSLKKSYIHINKDNLLKIIESGKWREMLEKANIAQKEKINEIIPISSLNNYDLAIGTLPSEQQKYILKRALNGNKIAQDLLKRGDLEPSKVIFEGDGWNDTHNVSNNTLKAFRTGSKLLEQFTRKDAVELSDFLGEKISFKEMIEMLKNAPNEFHHIGRGMTAPFFFSLPRIAYKYLKDKPNLTPKITKERLKAKKDEIKLLNEAKEIINNNKDYLDIENIARDIGYYNKMGMINLLKNDSITNQFLDLGNNASYNDFIKFAEIRKELEFKKANSQWANAPQNDFGAKFSEIIAATENDFKELFSAMENEPDPKKRSKAFKDFILKNRADYFLPKGEYSKKFNRVSDYFKMLKEKFKTFKQKAKEKGEKITFSNSDGDFVLDKDFSGKVLNTTSINNSLSGFEIIDHLTAIDNAQEIFKSSKRVAYRQGIEKNDAFNIAYYVSDTIINGKEAQVLFTLRELKGSGNSRVYNLELDLIPSELKGL